MASQQKPRKNKRATKNDEASFVMKRSKITTDDSSSDMNVANITAVSRREQKISEDTDELAFKQQQLDERIEQIRRESQQLDDEFEFTYQKEMQKREDKMRDYRERLIIAEYETEEAVKQVVEFINSNERTAASLKVVLEQHQQRSEHLENLKNEFISLYTSFNIKRRAIQSSNSTLQSYIQRAQSTIKEDEHMKNMITAMLDASVNVPDTLRQEVSSSQQNPGVPLETLKVLCGGGTTNF